MSLKHLACVGGSWLVVQFLVGCGAVDQSQVDATGGSNPSAKRMTPPSGSPSDGSNFDEPYGKIVLCHYPPGDPDNHYTIAVGASAEETHLAHGDTPGPCPDDSDLPPVDADGDGVAADSDLCPDTPAGEAVDADGCSCSQRDGDLDGVADCDDACPATPAGDEVADNGCTLVVLSADAGADQVVFEGDVVTRMGQVTVEQGDVASSDLVFHWTQVSGDPLTMQVDGASLTVDTTGGAGEAVFELSVETADGAAAATDEFVLGVEPVFVMDVTAGQYHSFAVRNNQRGAGWGWNRYGQLGDQPSYEPVVSMSAGGTHTLMALADGTVWTFGSSALATSLAPVQVEGLADVVEVSALAAGGMMLDANGVVWGVADGLNPSCVLGDVAATSDGSLLGPMVIDGLPADVVQIATGRAHTVALDASGVAWVWGSRFGCTPRPVLDNVTDVAAGATNLCLFARGDGSAWAMGYNLHGQLGNGTTRSNFSMPTQVLNMFGVVDVEAGDRHSMFLRDDGTLWAAGWNHECQLGLEQEVDPVTPLYGDTVTVPQLVNLVGVVELAGGWTHTLAITADDTVWGWGSNNVGQLTTSAESSLSLRVCMPTSLSPPE